MFMNFLGEKYTPPVQPRTGKYGHWISKEICLSKKYDSASLRNMKPRREKYRSAPGWDDEDDGDYNEYVDKFDDVDEDGGDYN